MAAQEKIHVELAGRRYNAHYIVDAGVVAVSSAYGSKTVKLKAKDDPKVVATALLLDIVKGWRT